MKCRACNSSEVENILDLGDQPYANALLSSEQMAGEKKYPLSISICKKCCLVQLDYTADPKELFSNYFWVTSTSSTARTYAAHFCKEALARRQVKKDEYILEIASNDGTFLKEFQKQDLQVLGVDPAENITKQANEDGVPTTTAFFGEEVANIIIGEKGYPAIVYARNVLPHVANLHDFLKGLKACCTQDNILILEVHYAGKILEEVHYDSIYHEHLCYFTLKSLSNLLEQHGLYPYDAILSPISGGSVVIYISRREEEATKAYKKLMSDEEAKKFNVVSSWKEFAKHAYLHREQLLSALNKELGKRKRIVGYGASARSSTMLNFCGIDDRILDSIMDQNTLKQNNYTPGSHILIRSADAVMKENPDTVLLLAWNFKDEIIKFLQEFYDFHGNVILPLPYPVKIENLS